MKITQLKLIAVMRQIANEIYERNYESETALKSSDNSCKLFKQRKSELNKSELSQFKLRECSVFMEILEDLITDGVEGLNTFDDVMQLMLDTLKSSDASIKIIHEEINICFQRNPLGPRLDEVMTRARLEIAREFFHRFDLVSCDPRVAEFRKSIRDRSNNRVNNRPQI